MAMDVEADIQLELLKECELCRFRQQLPVTPESLLRLVEFCLQYDYSY